MKFFEKNKPYTAGAAMLLMSMFVMGAQGCGTDHHDDAAKPLDLSALFIFAFFLVLLAPPPGLDDENRHEP